jgi:hypothetical protein
MVATWLVELYLSKLNDLEDLASSAHCSPPPNEPANLEPNTREFFLEQLEDIGDEFKSFLETYNGHLHRPTTYHLMTTQGRTDEYLFFASLIGDYDKVIGHWITEKNWTKALNVLSKEVSNYIYISISKRERGRLLKLF